MVLEFSNSAVAEAYFAMVPNRTVKVVSRVISECSRKCNNGYDQVSKSGSKVQFCSFVVCPLTIGTGKK